MSGGSSANMRASSSIVWRRRGELTSSEIANATAHSRLAAGLDRRLARELDAQPRDVDPVARVALERRARCSASGAERIDQVAVESTLQPAGEVPAVHVEHGLGRLVERARAPQLLVGRAAREPLHLGLDAAVEDHAALARRAATRCAGSRARAPGALPGGHRRPTPASTRSRAARCSKDGQALELGAALDDLAVRQPLEPLAAEVLDRERRHHRAVGGGAAQARLVERVVGVAVEVAEEAAGERVAGAGRVDDPVERHARDEEEALVAAHACAVAALLDHEHARPVARAAARPPS